MDIWQRPRAPLEGTTSQGQVWEGLGEGCVCRQADPGEWMQTAYFCIFCIVHQKVPCARKQWMSGGREDCLSEGNLLFFSSMGAVHWTHVCTAAWSVDFVSADGLPSPTTATSPPGLCRCLLPVPAHTCRVNSPGRSRLRCFDLLFSFSLLLFSLSSFY